MRASTSPIFWPANTRSPVSTRGCAGAPACWDSGMTTSLGNPASSTGCAAEALFLCGGKMPFAKLRVAKDQVTSFTRVVYRASIAAHPVASKHYFAALTRQNVAGPSASSLHILYLKRIGSRSRIHAIFRGFTTAGAIAESGSIRVGMGAESR